MPLVHSIMSEDISFRRIMRLARYVEGAALYMMHVSAKAFSEETYRFSMSRALAILDGLRGAEREPLRKAS